MASLGTPRTWIPYVNNKDCTQGFCSVYCPQWCYIVFSPPPPYEFPDDSSSPSFSPLVIAIIGILASAFLLVSYYTLISKYCGNGNSATRREHHEQNEELEDNHNPSLHEPWQVATAGLDEALIKSITVCKYKKGDGLIEGTDCSVCLSEFQEDESLRLLPKCSHAFHVPCIDAWLRSHSNCPLCRANIVFIGASLPQLPPPPLLTETPQGNASSQVSQQVHENAPVPQDMERVAGEEQILHNEGPPKTPLRVFSDIGHLQDRATIIEITEDGHQHSRRSISMDHSCQGRTSIADILRMSQEDGDQEDCQEDVGSSKHSAEINKHKRRVLHCVLNPVTMKRSFSSGRFFLGRHGRVCHNISPV
ncbi:hypothetical protein Tsubulata_011787 [Turnera subulata]|uniref:RING-type E3 ubiquitin transferase n=1 Tax=Turnera subulata TaxID=218843 RepID=A0A9Q0JNY8_9ROSI|nr:hypothetical protein Tsubulata_011787 [Turnera subulata]